MPGYIERDALWEEVQKSRLDNPHKFGPAKAAHDSEHLHFLRLIDVAPAADVAPVIHAHWVIWGEADDDNNVQCSCSACGSGDSHREGMVVPHCWFCGASMDEEATADE